LALQRQIFYSPLNLFFSLPFYPAGKRNCFYTGHLALAIEGTVYQIYDPQLLKADFLVSIMPVNDWLYEDSEFWVDRDKSSATYTHVHLYETAEAKRTTIFYCGLHDVRAGFLRETTNTLKKLNDDFRTKKIRFNLMHFNCATFIAELFCRERWIRSDPFNNIPALLFKKAALGWQKRAIELY
jgi:hypothetical protein